MFLFLPEPPLFWGTSGGRILGFLILGSRSHGAQYARCADRDADGSQRPGDEGRETGAKGHTPVNCPEDP